MRGQWGAERKKGNRRGRKRMGIGGEGDWGRTEGGKRKQIGWEGGGEGSS